MTALGATAPAVSAEFDVSVATVGVAFAFQSLGMIGGSALVGSLRHRHLRVWPLSLATAGAIAVAAVAPSFLLFTFALTVAGIGCYTVNAGAQAAMMRSGGADPAPAIGRFHVYGGVGAVGFPLVTALLLSAGVSWRGAFALLALVYCVYAAACFRISLMGAVRTRGGRPRISPRARWAAVVVLVGAGIQVCVPLFLASLVVDRFGTSEAAGSATVAAYWFGMLAARVGGTRLLPRLGSDRELWISCAFLVAGYVGLGAATGHEVVTAGALLIGAGCGQLFPLAAVRVARELGDAGYSAGLVFALNGAALVVIPLAVSALLTVVEIQEALIMTSPLVVLVAVGVARSRLSPEAGHVA